jgi:hypothetical protein
MCSVGYWFFVGDPPLVLLLPQGGDANGHGALAKQSVGILPQGQVRSQPNPFANGRFVISQLGPSPAAHLLGLGASLGQGVADSVDPDMGNLQPPGNLGGGYAALNGAGNTVTQILRVSLRSQSPLHENNKHKNALVKN